MQYSIFNFKNRCWGVEATPYPVVRVKYRQRGSQPHLNLRIRSEDYECHIVL